MKNDRMIAYGKNTVIDLLTYTPGQVARLYIYDGMKKQDQNLFVDLAQEGEVSYEFVGRRTLDNFTDENHQGVVVELPPYRYSSLEAAMASAQAADELPFFVMLDGITDPRNLGAILRSAETAGVHGIIIPKNRASGITPTVLKTATGATEHLHIIQVTNLNQTMEQMKKQGIWFVAAQMDGQTYWGERFDMPLCLVIGSEGDGISKLVEKNCDLFVSIPMKGKITSLNASVAAALLMYEVNRSRR